MSYGESPIWFRTGKLVEFPWVEIGWEERNSNKEEWYKHNGWQGTEKYSCLLVPHGSFFVCLFVFYAGKTAKVSYTHNRMLTQTLMPFISHIIPPSSVLDFLAIPCGAKENMKASGCSLQCCLIQLKFKPSPWTLKAWELHVNNEDTYTTIVPKWIFRN